MHPDEAELHSKLWPETEERIDNIGQNGGDGLHYLDVKRQMIDEPTLKDIMTAIIELQDSGLMEDSRLTIQIDKARKLLGLY